MSRIWMSGFVLVAAIAALKTFIVLKFAMPNVDVGPAMVSGFSLYFLD
ncbi:hypothetical protein [Litoreibacter halocynthiae]|nr:hypothetical protein [Litoreibacter halocynthiae]